MSDTAQIFWLIFMFLVIAFGFLCALYECKSLTIWSMGVALILGVMLF